MTDTIFYLVDNGIKWRALPRTFPPWKTVYGVHAPEPSAAIIDSQFRPGAGPRHPHGQLRDLDPQAGTDRHLALLRDLAGLMSPQDRPRASLQSAKYQDPPTESSSGVS